MASDISLRQGMDMEKDQFLNDFLCAAVSSAVKSGCVS
jgi:hypothetical protein